MSVLEDKRVVSAPCGKWYTAALTGMQYRCYLPERAEQIRARGREQWRATIASISADKISRWMVAFMPPLPDMFPLPTNTRPLIPPTPCFHLLRLVVSTPPFPVLDLPVGRPALPSKDTGGLYTVGLGKSFCLGEGTAGRCRSRRQPAKVRPLGRANVVHVACGISHVAALVKPRPPSPNK